MNAHTKRFSGWSISSRFETLLRLSIWWLRGFFIKMTMAKAKGMVLIGPKVKIYYSRKLNVGNSFVMERGSELNCKSLNGIHIGDRVTIGSYAIIRPSNIYGGDIGDGLTIGNDSNIGPYSYIGCSGQITIGNNVMISPRVGMYAENHNFTSIEIPMKQQGVTRKGITIKDDCWIASNTIILAGVTIGEGCVVGAGSVVTKDVPPFSVVVGNPAIVVKSRK
jgi:acetyltransferase-like isoleucine patch superfamily enzyme